MKTISFGTLARAYRSHRREYPSGMISLTGDSSIPVMQLYIDLCQPKSVAPEPGCSELTQVKVEFLFKFGNFVVRFFFCLVL